MNSQQPIRPRFRHVLIGHLLWDTIVSFPVNLLLVWAGLRFILRRPFDNWHLAAIMLFIWLAASVIDAIIGYRLQQVTHRTQPPMPRPLIAVKLVLPFCLGLIAAVLWHTDAAIGAEICLFTSAVRSWQIFFIEQPWIGEDQSVIDRRSQELRQLNRETLDEIHAERLAQMRQRSQSATYDPYDLLGNRKARNNRNNTGRVKA